MHADLSNAISVFAGLNHREQSIVLARFAFELTIVARDTYVPGSDAVRNPERLRVLNEIQHTVTGRLRDLLIEREWDNANEQTWTTAFEMAERSNCLDDVRYACKKSMTLPQS